MPVDRGDPVAQEVGALREQAPRGYSWTCDGVDHRWMGMSIARKPYPSDVSDEEWALVAPYLTLLPEAAGPARAPAARGVQRSALYRQDRRALALDAARPAALGSRLPADPALAGGRLLRGAGPRPAGRAAAGRRPQGAAERGDLRQPDLRSTPESGERAGYDGAKRKQGSKLHVAVDTLGHLLALHVTPASAGDRAEVGRMAEAVQAATGDKRRSWPLSTRDTTARSRPKLHASMASGWRS